MKSPIRLPRLLPALALVASLAAAPLALAKSDLEQITVSVGRLLEEGHYTHQPLNDEVSRKFLQTYLDELDFSHLFFTQKDVDAMAEKYGTALDDDVLLGNLAPAYEIYALYTKRVEDRVAKIKELLNQPMDFKSDRSIELSRQKVPWPKDDAEADDLWRGRIESELLQEHLSEHPIEPGPTLVARRYDRLVRSVHEEDKEEQVKLFLVALAQTYDPHSEYLSKSDLKNFSINMGLTLVGIGAMLRSEDGYAKIENLVPGGPAQVDGRLKVGDRITAVAQGSSEFVDSRDMRLDKVVEMIRGKKGTHVRLLVIPSDATDPSRRKNVELVRDEIKLKDQEARADIIQKKDGNGNPVKLGWITLPSFYADMDGKHQKSTTRDVQALLKRLKKENIAGLVIDLRHNGGGSLEESIALSGLFIKSGPVVQTKGSNGNITVSSDPDPALVYGGPMVVLTSRQSASASEIFAAAMQDYGRALIVGDKNTFGKGTVQTILEIGRFTSLLGSHSQDDGALKLTIQKFYRVAGGSTQLHGVASDIVLPSLTDLPEFSEGALKNVLQYDEVPKAKYTKWSERLPFLDELKRRSDARVAASQEFHYVMEDVQRLRHKLDDNRITLNENTRREQLNEDKLRKETRSKERLARKPEDERVYRLTLETVDSPKLQLIMFPGKLAANSKKNGGSPKVAPEAAPDADSDLTGNDDETKDPAVDPEREETLNILADLVELSHGPKTASTGQ